MSDKTFTLKEDLRQRHLRLFLSALRRHKPDEWESIEDMPLVGYFDILIRAAIDAEWVEEDWTLDEFDDLPLPNDSREWGETVFQRYRDVMVIDPNSS